MEVCKIERPFDYFIPSVTEVQTLSTETPSADSARTAGKALAKPLHKGQQTRAAILEAALSLASHMGLEGLSIGALAEVTQMSKSGVFAHFGSREELQISVIREYHARFEEEVFFPAIQETRGLPRLQPMRHLLRERGQALRRQQARIHIRRLAGPL